MPAYTQAELSYIKNNISILTLKEIAENMNRSYNSIRALAHRMKLNAAKSRGHLWTNEEDELLKANYEYATKQTLKKLFPSRTYSAIIQHGEKIFGLKRKNQDRYGVDYNFFSRWTEASGYYLGFIIADGYVHSGKDGNYLQIAVAEQDKDILEKFIQATKYEGHIQKGCSRKTNVNISGNYISNVQEGCRITIGNYKIVHDLFSLGIPKENKTYTIKFPKNIPDNMIKHVIRGIIDGDGWVTIAKRNYVSFGVCGTESIVQGIKDNIPFDCSVNKIRHKGKNYWDFIINGKKAMDILDWLYKGSVYHLDRKYKKYLEAKKLYKNSPLLGKPSKDRT